MYPRLVTANIKLKSSDRAKSAFKPIAVKRHLQLLPQVFKIDLPKELIDAVDACKTNQEVRKIGVEWAIQQSKEPQKAGLPVLHFYSMGKSDNIKAIASELF